MKKFTVLLLSLLLAQSAFAVSEEEFAAVKEKVERLKDIVEGYSARIHANLARERIIRSEQADLQRNTTRLLDKFEAFVPAGSILPFSGQNAPSGYVFCDGSWLSKTTERALFAVIGDSYSTVLEQTNHPDEFKLPDLRGRVPVGKDDMGTIAANRVTATGCGIDGTVLGAEGGDECVTLSEQEMPSHVHDPGTLTITGGAHKHATTEASHGHNGGLGKIEKLPIDLGKQRSACAFPGYNKTAKAKTGLTVDSESHSHPSTEWTGQTSSTGGNLPHSNVQPGIILNYIIKK
jgi:microcystin-dependent protein